MTDPREALEVLVNLLYLIEFHAPDNGKVLSFVHQAAGPVQLLREHFANAAKTPDVEKAA